MLGHWRWYRRWRGGRWARVTGYVWGYRWVRLPPQAVIPPGAVVELYPGRGL